MRFLKIFLLTLTILSFLISNIRPQANGEYALYIVKNLSDKEYLGRQGGTLENERALNFLKNEITKLEVSSHIITQEFPLNVYLLKERPILEFYHEGEILYKGEYRKDFRDILSGSWEISGEINYVNYGLKIEDYKESKEKISISKLGYENPKEKNLDRIDYRSYLAVMNSSLGLGLIVDDSKNYIVLQKSLSFNNLPIPVFYLSHEFWNNIEKFYKKNKNMKLRYKISYEIKKETSKNLFVVIPGEEEKYIIISAHIDHIGKDFDGTFFPGANDNSSGVGVLIEVMKIIKERNIKPKYNIIFAFFNGEEYGLKGSEYYIKNPIFPLEKTYININIDCVGRGKYLYLVYNRKAEKYIDELRKINEKIIPLEEHFLLSQSDQYSFVRANVPVIFLTRANEDLSMPDLHQKTDTYEKIPYQNLSEVIDLIIKFISIMDKERR